MTDVKKTLTERGKNYGSFVTHSSISEGMNVLLEEYGNHLQAHHKEALRIIFNKIGRILNGNPDYIDSWRDIAGYSQLVVDILQTTEGARDVKLIPVTIGEAPTITTTHYDRNEDGSVTVFIEEK